MRLQQERAAYRERKSMHWAMKCWLRRMIALQHGRSKAAIVAAFERQTWITTAQARLQWWCGHAARHRKLAEMQHRVVQVENMRSVRTSLARWQAYHARCCRLAVLRRSAVRHWKEAQPFGALPAALKALYFHSVQQARRNRILAAIQTMTPRRRCQRVVNLWRPWAANTKVIRTSGDRLHLTFVPSC